jgi:hypothetical protein
MKRKRGEPYNPSFGCNEILRASDAAIDLLAEQHRLLMRCVLWTVQGRAVPPQMLAEKPIVTDSDTK